MFWREANFVNTKRIKGRQVWRGEMGERDERKFVYNVRVSTMSE